MSCPVMYIHAHAPAHAVEIQLRLHVVHTPLRLSEHHFSDPRGEVTSKASNLSHTHWESQLSSQDVHH